MIAAVIGEELGLMGIAGLAGLFGLFGYAGLRTAQRARDRYSEAARRRPRLAGHGPGDRQPLRGPRPGAADRRAAAVRLLRQLEPAGDAGRRRAAAEHRGRGPRCQTARASKAAGRRRPRRHEEELSKPCQGSR